MIGVPGRDHDTGADRVVIVTGGSRGLGGVISRRLAGRGFAVVVGYSHDQRAAEGVVDDILDAGGTAMAIRGEVTDELDMERLFSETQEAFGRVDVVVNAFGGFAVEQTRPDLATFDSVLGTAGRGTFIVDRQAAQDLRDGGRIVNLAGPLASPGSARCVAHAAGAATIAAITRTLAVELQDRRITVNAVVVGPGAAGDEDSVAALVTVLVGPAGGAVTGQVIRAGDRGASMTSPPTNGGSA